MLENPMYREGYGMIYCLEYDNETYGGHWDGEEDECSISHLLYNQSFEEKIKD